MIIYAKIGTLSAKYVGVVRKRKAPVVGECFKVYEQMHNGKPERYQKPSGVLCDEIRTVGGELLYFCERM